MDKIKEQATLVGQLVFAGETGEIYKKMFSRTWDILRETGRLLWLVLCLTFVGGEWFYRNSVGLGRRARTWYANFSAKGAESEAPSLEVTGAALLESLKSGTHYLLSQARQQLGLPEAPPAAPTPQASPTPVVEAPAPVPMPVAEAPAPTPAPLTPLSSNTTVTDDADF